MCDLTWDLFPSHAQNLLQQMLETNCNTDVTLVCDDQKTLRAHKVVLSAGSPVFRNINSNLKGNDSVIYLKGIKYEQLEPVLRFMYLGQVSIREDTLKDLLDVAKELEVKGLNKKVTVEDDEGEKLPLDSPSSVESIEEDTDEKQVKMVSTEIIKKELISSLNQPILASYAPRMFGAQKRDFNSRWFQIYPWLEWNEEAKAIVCFCCENFSTYKLRWKSWKNTENLRKHAESDYHHMAFIKWTDPDNTAALMEIEEKIKSKTKRTPSTDDLGPFICAECGDVLDSRKARSVHVRLHKKKEKVCDFNDCNEVFLHKQKYVDHMLLQHQKVIKLRKWVQPKISMDPGSKDEPSKEEHREYQCSLCEKSYPTSLSLKWHINYVHVNATTLFTCNEDGCGKSFKNKSKLRVHSELHSAPSKKCPFCDKLFHSELRIKIHIRSKHVDDDQMLYQCEQCHKGFSAMYSYEAHMNDHKNIRPYECALCEKTYRNSVDFKHHIVIAHPSVAEEKKHVTLDS